MAEKKGKVRVKDRQGRTGYIYPYDHVYKGYDPGNRRVYVKYEDRPSNQHASVPMSDLQRAGKNYQYKPKPAYPKYLVSWTNLRADGKNKKYSKIFTDRKAAVKFAKEKKKQKTTINAKMEVSNGGFYK